MSIWITHPEIGPLPSADLAPLSSPPASACSSSASSSSTTASAFHAAFRTSGLRSACSKHWTPISWSSAFCDRTNSEIFLTRPWMMSSGGCPSALYVHERSVNAKSLAS